VLQSSDQSISIDFLPCASWMPWVGVRPSRCGKMKVHIHAARVGLEDAPHNRAVRQHVEVIVLPFTGRAGGRCAFEDEIILFHRATVCHAQESP
jgi:hypothetical protein